MPDPTTSVRSIGIDCRSDVPNSGSECGQNSVAVPAVEAVHRFARPIEDEDRVLATNSEVTPDIELTVPEELEIGTGAGPEVFR